jgi:hypothetical protein
MTINQIATVLATALLAGCGGLDRSQQLFPTASSAGVVLTPDISLQGEKLDTKKITVRADCGSKTWDIDFKAHGRASGPYPGTFYTGGSWTSESGGGFGTYQYRFKERFTIHSGKNVIKGTASSDWELGNCYGYSSKKGEVTWYTKDPKESGSLVINGITQYGLYEEFEK